MKKSVIALLLAGSMIAGGATAFIVQKATSHGGFMIVDNPDKVPAHFTNYQKEEYPDLTYAAENAVQAVVSIEKTESVRSRSSQGYNPFYEFFGIPQEQYEQQQPQYRQQRSGGSGVLITADGYIVSNNHVVENASDLKVTLYDGRTFHAKVIGTDPTTDVALIKIEGTGFPFLAFGDSNALRLGEWVLAIGTPYELRSTVTAGIVSAKGRSLNVIPSQFSIESFIQTDAAVNPGNSGGALVNTKGELVGINTLIQSPTGSYTGYSFAIPSSIVKKVVTDLQEYGVVQRAMLGVSLQEINDDFIEQRGAETGIKERGGVYVATVDPDGAANAAGIKVGDVIVSIDGTKTDTPTQVIEIIGSKRPNEKVSVSVKRGNETKQFEVVLRNKSGKAELVKKEDIDVTAALGGVFQEISDKTKKDLKIDNGIQVVRVTEGGILAKARVKPGYIITAINEKSVRTVSDLAKFTTQVELIEGVYPDGRIVSYSLSR